MQNENQPALEHTSDADDPTSRAALWASLNVATNTSSSPSIVVVDDEGRRWRGKKSKKNGGYKNSGYNKYIKKGTRSKYKKYGVKKHKNKKKNKHDSAHGNDHKQQESGYYSLKAQRTYDGTGNNLKVMSMGGVGDIFRRKSEVSYAGDKTGRMQALDMTPGIGLEHPRVVSNRIFNDQHYHIYSERGLSEWAFVWGWGGAS